MTTAMSAEKDEATTLAARPAAARSPARGAVAYIAHYFPALTQTFVYREIQALEELGQPVRYFSIRRPVDGVSGEAEAMAARTTYLIPVRPLLFLARMLSLFAAHPVRFLRIFFLLLLEPGETLKGRVHALTHFFGGMYLVPDVKRSGATHFHAHFGKNPATIALVVSEYLGIPFSMTIHATDLFVSKMLLPLKLRRAKFVASISDYNRGKLAALAADPAVAARIKVLHCGIDLRRFPPRGGAPRQPGPARLLAVGRLVEKKGYKYLLEAVRILLDHGLDFEAVVIGGGPDHEALERQREALGLGSRLRLDGALPQEKLLPLLREADVFVLPCVRAGDGDQDGIPVSLMEAMAYEIACVSTELSGIPELIESEKEGILVPERDPAALAAALERLVRDPSLRQRLGQAGRRKVERSFNLQAVAAELDGLYSS